MSKPNFTKGIWTVSGSGLNVYGSDGRTARAYSGENVPYTQKAKANAHLIAAAPEMYKELLSIFNSPFTSIEEDDFDRIEALLAKARGESCK